MRYVQLRAFHHVAIHGGFTKAAEKLHLTQPAISDQVRRLESQYDVRLFDRQKKQVKLTEAGQKLLEITRRLFEVENLAGEFLLESQVLHSGTLRIIADSTIHIQQPLQRFRDKYPGIFVSVSTGNTQDVLDDLYRYTADIGVLGEMPETRDYDSILLSSTPIVAFAAADHAIAAGKSLTFAELASQPLVLREKGSKTRAKLEQHAEHTGIKLNIRVEAEGREAVSHIVKTGGCIGFVSEAEFTCSDDLVKINISDARLTMDEALICLRERNQSRLIATFFAIAVNTIGGMQ